MATIIDFTPAALDIDAIATILTTTGSIPDAPIAPIATTNAAGDTALGTQFASSAPDILFIAEYAPQNQPSLGAMIVWEDYYNATHYELYRRDYMAMDDAWKRVLIVDKTHLATETAQFKPYIENTLKLALPNSYYAILDTGIGADRITEYKIVASSYPTAANVDLGLVLNSKGHLRGVPVSTREPTQTVFDFSLDVFGSPDFAWIISLLNVGVPYFGMQPATKPLADWVGTSPVLVPFNVNTVAKAVEESISIFGLQATLKNLLLAGTKDVDHVASNAFYASVADAANDNSITLSYRKLQQSLINYNKNALPIPLFGGDTIVPTNLRIAAFLPGTGSIAPVSAAASASLPTFNYDDQTVFNSINGLTMMFLRINSLYLSLFGPAFSPFPASSLGNLR